MFHISRACARSAVFMLALPMLWAPGCATIQGGAQSVVLGAKNKVAPALVHIRPVKEVYIKGKREEVVVIGSGFIVSDDGYVVTNEHVAGDSKFVKCVLSSKEEVEAKVVGVDPYTDVAVMKLAVKHPVPFVKWGDAAKLESGQTVLALGSPHGLSRSVSMGIISITDRYLADDGGALSPYNNWIQTDAAINPGNSGGPLVNLRGEVIGVNARVLSGAENVGFAIPVDIAREAAEKIIATGKVQRSDIGVSLQEMLAKTENPAQQGVVIADVDPLSPAHSAGVLPGDLLLSINGQAVNARFEEDLPRVRKAIADLPVGAPAELGLLRGDGPVSVKVLTEELSALKGKELEFPEWGFTARELTAELVRRAQLPARAGVIVTGTQVGGLATEAGLGKADILLGLDSEPIKNLTEFQAAYKQRVEGKQELVLLHVKRGALTRFVMIKQRTEGPAGPGIAIDAPATAPREPGSEN